VSSIIGSIHNLSNKSLSIIFQLTNEVIGPSPEILDDLGDKVAARKAALKCGIPVVPGTDGPVTSSTQAADFVREFVAQSRCMTQRER
jgi:pyruvate carboxylase